MNIRSAPRTGSPRQRANESWLGRGLGALGRSAALLGLWVADIGVLCIVLVSFSLLPIGLGILLVPPSLDALRGLARTHRRLAGTWSGITVEDPYRPEPTPRPGIAGIWARFRWMMTDPATWRDLIWMILDVAVGLVLPLLAICVGLNGLWGLLLPLLWEPVVSHWGNSWYLFVLLRDQSSINTSVVLGLLQVPLALAMAPHMVTAHSWYISWVLGPTESTRLANHVQQLSRTRAETLDSSAAELRRIERDLHDGAQSRLVAMGMTLTAAERLLETNPEAVGALLVEARDASAKALRELRGLVRGIHPPVLADRGLPDAVNALAADSPLSVRVTSSLTGRLTPAIESAAYFTVSELMNNAVKHARAQHLSVDIDCRDEHLTIRVADDGQGGADPRNGSGLCGIQRRLDAFDGILTVHSPIGGPTAIDVNIPACHVTIPDIPPARPPL
ncbi:MAG: hypothetical protein QG622_1688 [Actinomycetota bacterium]|nr:hypothetical protein [Actinomycetota bacterium]